MSYKLIRGCSCATQSSREDEHTQLEMISAQCSSSSLSCWLLGGCSAAVAASCLYHLYLLVRLPGEASMSWTAVPVLGHALAFGQNPIKTVQQLSQEESAEGGKKSKEIVGLLLAGKRVFLLNDPSSFKVIFKARRELSFKEFSKDVMINVFGSTPDSWEKNTGEVDDRLHQLHQRYLLNDSGCRELTACMQTKLAAVVADIFKSEDKSTKVVNLQDFVNRLVYRASTAALFNEALADDEELYQRFLAFDEMFSLALAGIPLQLLPNGLRGREQLLSRLTSFREDISDYLRKRYDAYDKGGFVGRDLAANQLAILWASVGNTMPGAYWVLYYTLRHPDAFNAIQAEFKSVLGDKTKLTDNIILTYDELTRLVVLDSAISEALRLSSGSLVMRRVVEPCSLTLSTGNSYTFRKGDCIGIFPPAVHHDPLLYDNPEEFRHDRFLVSQCPVRKKLPNGQAVSSSACLIPFGGGSSYCPGRKFARNEIKIMVAQMLLRFHICFCDEASLPPVPEMDYSRAGLGIFLPKDSTLNIAVTPK